MSDDRKPKTVHVDKLTIRANQIHLVQDEPYSEEDHKEQKVDHGFQDVKRDIWGFPIPADAAEENEAEEDSEHEDHERDEDGPSRPPRGSWI